MASDSLTTQDLCGEKVNPDGTRENIRNFNYRFRPGAFYQLCGPEFSGKHLLQRMLSLMLPSKSGEIWIDGIPVANLDVDDLSEIRNRKYGFLFSAPFLLPSFTVLENVAMPLFKVAQVQAREAKMITDEVLEIVGVTGIAGMPVEYLDEQSELLTALARALVHHPKILIAESVGAQRQDAEACAFLDVIRSSSSRFGLTVIATFAPHVSWPCADFRLEIGENGVKEFGLGDLHG